VQPADHGGRDDIALLDRWPVEDMAATEQERQEDEQDHSALLHGNDSSLHFIDEVAPTKYTIGPGKAKWGGVMSDSTDLKKAGYKLSGGKLYPPRSSTQVAFSLSFPSSYSDWLTDCSIIKQNLTTIGINLTCDGMSYQEWSADYLDSNFQATFDTQVGPLPYNEYDQVFGVPTGGLPPLGKPNNYTNVERYNNSPAVAALNKLEVTNPNNTVAQKQQVALLQNIYVHSLPVIPMFDSTYHEDFVNGPLYGWPSYKDPYMCTFCNAYQEQILLSVHKK
jgi:peptide/nickel transport system substrate-binding protein